MTMAEGREAYARDANVALLMTNALWSFCLSSLKKSWAALRRRARGRKAGRRASCEMSSGVNTLPSVTETVVRLDWKDRRTRVVSAVIQDRGGRLREMTHAEDLFIAGGEGRDGDCVQHRGHLDHSAHEGIVPDVCSRDARNCGDEVAQKNVGDGPPVEARKFVAREELEKHPNVARALV